MSAQKIVNGKAKAHQRYTTSEGVPVPGVTTILSVMDKPGLVKWANKLGLNGYDVTKWVDGLARIGTLIHYLVECDIKGIKSELNDYSPNEVETARVAFGKWEQWKSKNQFKLIASEMKLVSDEYKFGGTCDIYAVINGKNTVLDIKTGKGVYSEMKTQVVAYKKLLEELKDPVDECRIIRIGRDEGEGFEDVLVGGHELHFRRFLACLDLYRCNQDLKNVE